MLKFRKRGHHAKIEELQPDHFTFRRTAYHGFPSAPSAISYEPASQLLAIGTKYGDFRVYGRPGIEFRASTDNKVPIKEIFAFRNLHQFITVSGDNSVVLWELSTDGQPLLTPTKEFKMDPEGGKKITKCCLSQRSGHFYIGTECGNVFILDVKHFQLDSELVYWNNATSLVQPSTKTHPGIVRCLELCPADHNLLLIGYEKGVVVLWNLESGQPTKNFPASIQDCQQPLESLCWQNEGIKFVSAHSDSSIYFWGVTSSTPHEGPTIYYDTGGGENSCCPVTKIQWLNTDANPLLIFTGGLPTEEDDEHHTVTVIQGADHIALDFTSPIVDFVATTDPGNHRGRALIVLCEQEVMAFDLEAPKCPQIRKPYLFTLHASPVTCSKLYENCSQELYEALHEINITSPPPHEHFSQMEWPAMGGCVRASEPTAFDVLVTGHENGSVKFWDVTTGAMRLIYELKTANLFVGQEPDTTMMEDFADFKWPPYRKVSSYDPYEDDPRLAIKFIELCPLSKTLCVGGNGGQVIVFSLNPLPNEIRLESCTAKIFIGSQARTAGKRTAGFGKEAPLECKTDLVPLPAGFQANFCLRCIPATQITAVAFQPSWGLVAAGNSKGFVVANFLVKKLVLLHTTVGADGMNSSSLTRVQSIRRSIRDSFRRRRTASVVTDDRGKIAEAMNLEAGIQTRKQKGPRGRSTSEPASNLVETSPAHAGAANQQVSPELAGVVSHLAFYETHVSGGGASPCVIASTMGSIVIRYSFTLPEPQDRLVQINRAFIAGKDYALVHAAPVVGVFALDRDGNPLPDPYEESAGLVPHPNMRHPHFAVIVTQEQIKIVTLPGMKQKRKEKIADVMQERVQRAWVIKVKVPAASPSAERDWNPALVLLSSIGDLLVYSLPDLQLCFRQDQFIPASDQKAMQSTTISANGEILHLRTFSELERSLLCSYAFSYHTSMLPNLFPFEGSTQPVVIARLNNREQVVEAEVAPDVDSARSRRSETPSPESRTGGDAVVVNGTASREKSREREVGASTGTSSSLTRGVGKNQADGGVVNGETTKTQKSPSPDKEIANATNFLQIAKNKRGSVSSSSSSSSSSSDDSDDDEIPSPNLREDTTFGNPFAMGLDDLGDGGRELDNIIASSLQQLESARAFYEQMQARVKKSD